MRTIRHALLGAALLCALASLPGCATYGQRPAVLTTTKLVEAPKLQYVPIPGELLTTQSLTELPTPAFFDSADCAAGCYSNEQLRAALDTAIGWGGSCYDQLRGIRRLSDDAVATTAAPKRGSPEGKPP